MLGRTKALQAETDRYALRAKAMRLGVLPGTLYRRRGTHGVAVVGGVAGLAVCACAFSLLLGAVPALAAFPGKNGRILAMHELSGGEEALVTETPHGGEVQVIAEQPFYDPDEVNNNVAGKSQLSPDGSKVVLVGDPESEKGLKEEVQKEEDGEGEVSGLGPGLYVVPAGGGVPERINPEWRTGGCPQSVSWSPSGTEVVYARIPFHVARPGKRAGCVVEEGEEIMVAGVGGGGGGTKIATGRDPVWSSTGQIAYIAGEGIQIVGGAFIPIEEPLSVDWSPHGKRLVIMSHIRFTTKDPIWTVNANGSGRTLLATGEELIPPATWSPDGQSILANVFSHELFHVLIMNANEPDDQIEGEGCTYVGSAFGQGLSWGVGSGGSEFEICNKGSEPTEAEREEEYGLENQSTPHQAHCMVGGPVDCATGNQVEAQTDLTVGGRGLGLNWTRTYNSQSAAIQYEAGTTGYGWTASYGAHLTFSEDGDELTVHQDNGSTVVFDKTEAGAYVAPNKLAQATLAAEGSGYVYTLPDQTKLYFNSSGVLTSEADRNGNTLTMNRNAEGRLESVSDAAGRKLTLAYNAEGQVESVTDPIGRTVKYTYEGGDLSSVTEPGESSLRWRFKYNASHELTSEADALGNTMTSEYYGSHRMASQTDALGRKRTWQYPGTELDRETRITEPNGSITLERFGKDGQPASITHAAETPLAATTEYEYESAGNLIAVTDPNGHKTTFGYNAAGDRTSEKNTDGDEKKWTYDSKHDIETETTPDGETTTIKRNSAGDPEAIERPAPGSTMQKTTYKYDSYGDVESMTDPLEHTWEYEYDAYGDRKNETDSEGNKRTWEYNEDSQEIATVSPRGNASGAEASKFTTKIERDAQGRPLLVTEPGANSTRGPVDKTGASISGPARETQTLSAGTGIWEGAPSLSYVYQWQHCNTSGGSCANISGATGTTYALTSGDAGTTLRVVVTTTNSWGSASSTSAATAVVEKAAALGAAYPPRFAMKFGSEGSSNGQFKRPKGIAVDANGDVWVADTKNNRVQEFSPTGEYLRQFGSEGTGNGQFKSPADIAVAENGDLWVTDSLNDRVEEFSPTGGYLAKFGSEGTGNGQFTEPVGIAIAPNGHIWVTDARFYRVEEFSSTGAYITKVGTDGSGNGQFFGPLGVATDPNGDIWVADTRNNRVQELSSTGGYLSQFGSKGTSNGQLSEPAGIAVDPAGDIWVVDTRNNRIEGFTNAGEYITQFGTKGSGSEQFSEPEGLAIDSKDDLWIADRVNSRIQEWKAAVSPLDTATPSISGELLSGQVLSASNGTWTTIPNPAYTYQWRRCNATGSECSTISGATSSTYVLGHADVGSALRVVVTATNSAGSAESTSAATEVMPSAGVTEYAYDANGNLLSVTDPDGDKTTYTYNADNERTKVEEPNKTVTETKYDTGGNTITQIDGNKHITKYERNALEEVTEVVDPLGHKTLKEYDAAGNFVKVTDPKGRTTTYTYDPANRLTKVSYSSGNPATIKYEYNKDGRRTTMTDGTGTSAYAYDQLDRLTESENGHKEVVKYEYNLGNEQAKITYPNEKSVTRAFDKDGRLDRITDWSSNVTKFTYDADSDLAATVFPSATEDEDTYAYNNADRVTEVKMAKGSETLASLAYARDNEGQVETATSKGVPGAEVTEGIYDENSRLTKSDGTEYKYDAADNPTTIGSSTNTYNEGDELEKGTGMTYSYDELGERTKTTPEKGPTTTYGYDQAGNLISVERPKEGETAEIKDTYAYNGEGLRTSQTISGTTTYMAWDMTEELPLILSDGTNSYIYEPGGLPIEQISNGGTVTYLHHDQQGSTRLLTGSTGTVTGSTTFDAYGNKTGSTGSTTTTLGYDGQYTSTDTGLIYLRARVYDPATAQFLTVDPQLGVTHAPYTYASDNPTNRADLTGLESLCKSPAEKRELERDATISERVSKAREAHLKSLKEQVAEENINERRSLVIEEYKEITKAWVKATIVGGACFKGGALAGVCEALVEPEPAE